MRYIWLIIAAFAIGTVFMQRFASADPRTDCPAPLTACKVMVISPDEEKVLMDQNGILNTAAAARQLDLGNLASYFRQKITAAPAGDASKPTSVVGSPPDPQSSVAK